MITTHQDYQDRLDEARTMERAYRDQALRIQSQYLEAMRDGTATDGLAIRHREALGDWLQAQQITATAKDQLKRSASVQGQRAGAAVRRARSGARRVQDGARVHLAPARPLEGHHGRHA